MSSSNQAISSQSSSQPSLAQAENLVGGVKENPTADFKYFTDFISQCVAEDIIADISKNTTGLRIEYIVDFITKCTVDKLILKAAEETKLNQHEGIHMYIYMNSYVESIVKYIGDELVANLIENVLKEKATDNAKDKVKAGDKFYDKTTVKNSVKSGMVVDITRISKEEMSEEKFVDQIQGVPEVIINKSLQERPENQTKGANADKIKDKTEGVLENKNEDKPKEEIENVISWHILKDMPINQMDDIIKSITYCITKEVIQAAYQMCIDKLYENTTEDSTNSSVDLLNSKCNVSFDSRYDNEHDKDSDGFITEEQVTTDEDMSGDEQSKEHKFVERSTALKTIVEYVETYVVEELVQHTANTVVQSTADEIIMDLSEYINEYITDELIQSVAAKITDTVAESLTEKMGFISDNLMFNAIVNITRPKIARKSSVSYESSQEMITGKIESITESSSVSRESIRKISTGKSESPTEPSSVSYESSREIRKAKSEAVTDSSSVSPKFIPDQSEYALTSENVNLEMITDNVVKSAVHIEVEELEEITDGNLSDSQSITFESTSSVKSTDTLTNDKICGLNPANPHPATLMWKTFSDRDYVTGNVDAEVNERSFFAYVVVEEHPNYIVNVPKRPTLDLVLRDMVANNLGASIRVKIADRCFECIPKLLKIYSPFFADQDWRVENFEFSAGDVPPAAFELIYDWLRLQRPIQLVDAVKVIQAARHLKFDTLVTECWNLISQPHVREKVAFQLFLEAEQLPELDDVRDILLSRVRAYFLALVGSDLFVELQLEQLLSLLERDSIGVNTEAEVFFAAVRWLSKSKERLSDMKAVMQCVRFEYMSMPMLFAIRDMGQWKDPRPIGTTDRVLQEFQKDPEMPQMLLEAMTYISLHFQNEIEPDPGCISPAVKQLYTLPRRWMYHPKCPYHSAQLVYPYQHILSQDDFNNFINSIQMEWMSSEPPIDSVLDVEFDGVKMLSPSLKSQCKASPTVESKNRYNIEAKTTSKSH